MSFNIAKVEALVWDIGGTVFDWHNTIKKEISELAKLQSKDINATNFTNKWRHNMFELLKPVRNHTAPWKNADQLHFEALEIVLNEFDWKMTLKEKEELNTIWHKLNAWQDAPKNIEKLRSRFKVAVLTVLSLKIAILSSKHNNISWDMVFSCEFLGHYKPDIKSYQKASELLGLRPEQVMMCAAHENDLDAAKKAGLRTAYVHVPEELEAVMSHYQLTKEAIGLNDKISGKIPDNGAYDIVAQDFNDLSKKLLI